MKDTMVNIAAADDPWGINGPDFLKLFLALMAAALVIAWINRRRALRAAGKVDRYPTATEAALLTGGRSRVVVGSIASLRAAELVTAGLRGTLATAVSSPPTGLSRVDYAVFDAASRRLSTTALEREPRVSAEVDEIERSAVAAGWYADDAVRKRARRGGWLLLILAGFGVTRIVVGASAGFPVGYLVALTVVTLVASLIMLAVPRVTSAGHTAINHLRLTNSHLAPANSPSYATYGALGAALGVGLFGTSVLYASEPAFAADAGIATDPHRRWTGNGGAAGDGGGGGGYDGGGSSGGGGSGCGGGGGGCGGGGGG